MARVVFSTKERSGSRCLVSGVGTQIEMTSHSAKTREVGCRHETIPSAMIDCKRLVADGADIGPARLQLLDLAAVDIEADHLEAGTRRGGGQRQADIAKADDTDRCRTDVSSLERRTAPRVWSE